jgi:hypothetical protein
LFAASFGEARRSAFGAKAAALIVVVEGLVVFVSSW